MTSSIGKHFRVAYCGGRACPKCYKCSDWYYDAANHNDCDPDPRVYAHHLGPLVGSLYRWHRHSDATCGYRSYPHYVYYGAYHGVHLCDLKKPCCLRYKTQSAHLYPKLAVHNQPRICHCSSKD
ncbi:unnamed protein product [Rotaria sp. Silwood2]|nr:unnamed protein product [Rotaria sp. Silwood2]CAF2973015.1 unnamed protein product [Rotaria sp. Silwood2]CAF3348717.1 unnamed protein product [Rotaria sp. Silwood2]CAF4073153.1 unnamed protein product [Rotaria sp. Silwood2]CAF4232371.1 unnamed protein product [Rotaria sp. Silwood2]